MRTGSLIGFCLSSLFIATDIYGQMLVPASIAAGYRAIQESDLRADLQFVSSDALQGRMSLQLGDDAAVQWIVSEFGKSGLKPVSNGSFLQPVPLIEFRND